MAIKARAECAMDRMIALVFFCTTWTRCEPCWEWGDREGQDHREIDSDVDIDIDICSMCILIHLSHPPVAQTEAGPFCKRNFGVRFCFFVPLIFALRRAV